MKPEDISVLVQLIESMDRAIKKLEDAIERKDGELTKKLKQEIMIFQREIMRLIG